MSSTFFYLCVSAFACVSSGDAALTSAPQTALLRIDSSIVSNLRKQLEEQRKWQQFRRTQLLRYRSLNEECPGSCREVVEEIERRLRYMDLRVAETEQSLRFYGVKPTYANEEMQSPRVNIFKRQ